MVGKPYSRKANVRFDEGELEIELLATTPALYSTGDEIADSLKFAHVAVRTSGQSFLLPLRFPVSC
jgi:hypothetical protein